MFLGREREVSYRERGGKETGLFFFVPFQDAEKEKRRERLGARRKGGGKEERMRDNHDYYHFSHCRKVRREGKKEKKGCYSSRNRLRLPLSLSPSICRFSKREKKEKEGEKRDGSVFMGNHSEERGKQIYATLHSFSPLMGL